MRLIGGESTGSYARRLAEANHIPLHEFWSMFGAPLRPGALPSDPRYSDGYLNAAALERLAVMAGRKVGELQCALPNVRPERLLDGGRGPVWDWPWDTSGCFLVRVCEMCALIKDTAQNAYLAADATWQVCARHGRWLDNRREPDAAALRLAALPEVVEAHQKRLLFERRLGAGGRVLFADAYAITSCWWNLPSLNARVWHRRRRAVGRAGEDELRVAPLVFYPEAVRLAGLLAARERQRLRRTLTAESQAAWVERVTGLLEAWDIRLPEGLMMIAIWARRHPPLDEPRSGERADASRPARGRRRPLPLSAGHAPHALDATLGERSCLPFRLGEMISADLSPAPGGWRLDGLT
ncbi:hypothetical protein ACIQWB_32085 [Streptomyces olivaceus]|uniref:hypothetical protein n=1 Tax=Streptomyces olivaceus TaxID=47716 RepID=UPI00382BE9A7